MRAIGSTLFLSLLLLTSLTSCAPAVSEPAIVVSAPVIDYSPAFQERLARELEALPRPCDRVAPEGECSAMKRAVVDYGWTRDRIRVSGHDRGE